MSCLSPYTVGFLAQQIIEEFNGADLKIYASGSTYPRHPSHSMSRITTELAHYRLATPCATFDDSGGTGKMVFSLPTRVGSSYDESAVPNFFRIYKAVSGECLYQGAARLIYHQFSNTNYSTSDDTITGALIMRPLDPLTDFRCAKDGGGQQFNVWPRWVDIDFTSFSIDFGLV